MLIKSLYNNCLVDGNKGFLNLTALAAQISKLHDFKRPPKYDNFEIPPDSRGKKLAIYPKVPQYPPQIRPYKMQRKLRLMRGPEKLHNELIHKQYGIVALMGGRLRHGHIEMIRLTANRKFPNNAFSVWRVDGPWQPITRKGHGTQHGGGKGAIDHYVTPLKSGRVIIEVGGPIEYEEVKSGLEEIAHKLPFQAVAVTYESLQKMKDTQKRIEEDNENPYNYKYVIQNNFDGCHNWISPFDKSWFGKYR